MDDKFNCMNSRFDKVEDKQMYHEVLLKNQKWVYSARRPSQEYWDRLEGDWHTYGSRSDAETFLEEIKNNTNKMRYGHTTRYYR